jgi:uncharacterized protein YegL
VTFGAPIWLGLMALAPLLAWLHFRRKRTEVVGSLLIWRKLSGSSSATERRSRVHVNWPLLLQLLAVTAVALALSEPRIGFGRANDHHVYLLDVSAPMLLASLDERQPLPLDEALAWLTAEIGALPDTARVSVILVGPRPELVLAGAPGGRATARRLPRSAGWAAAADWPLATAAVPTLVPANATITITALTSVANVAIAESALEESAVAEAASRVLRFGEPTTNLGFVDARWQRAVGSDTSLVLSAEVATAGPGRDVAAVVAFQPHGADGFVPLATVDVEVPEAGSAAFQLPLDLTGPGTLRVTLGSADDDPRDDMVELPVDFEVAARILVVGQTPEALQRVLALLQGVEAYQSDSVPASSDSYDLVIITDPASASIPRTSTLWLGSFPGGASSLETVPSPAITGWDFEHRLGSATTWSELEIGQAYVAPLLSGATSIAASGHVPLVQARFADVGLQVVVGFALTDSDWTERPGFPSFIAELLEMVKPEDRRRGVAACVVAHACALPRETRDGPWRLMGPGADGVVIDSSSSLVPTRDGFAEAYWPFGTGRSFVPNVPGTYLLGTTRTNVLVPVVANRSAFAVSSDVVQDATSQEGGGGIQPTSPPDPRTVLVVAFMAFAAAHAILVLRRRARGTASRAWRSYLLGLLVPAVAGAALLRLPWPVRPSDADVVLVLDSRGTAPSSLDPIPAVFADARRVVVVGLEGATNVERSADVSTDRDSIMPWTGAVTTPGFAVAIETAAAHARGTGARDVVLVNPSRVVLPVAVAEELAARLRSLGMRVSTLDDRVERVPGIAIENIEVPGGIRAGSVAEVGVTIWSAERRDAVFTVEVDGMVELEADVSLQQGSTSVSFPVRFGVPGVARLTASLVEPTATSSVTRTEIVEVETPLRAVIVASDALAGDALARALELQGFSTRREPPLNLPWDERGWRQWDLVVLVNVPAHALHSTQLDGLQRWVVEDGGGLLILGGETAFGPGGYLRTALDELSPLSSQVPREAPEVTMLFLLDRSGSMQQAVGTASRMSIAKEATLSAMGLLGPESNVGVIVYDAAAEVLVPVQSIQNLDAITERVGTIGASGGTALFPALVEAKAMLSGVESSAVHIVVLTDGMSQPGDFEGVLRELRADGATVSFVGIGSGADRVQLGDLAEFAGGALHITEDVRALPSILAQEALMASEELVQERTVEVTRPGDASQWFQAVPTLGIVHGYVLTEPRPSAEVLLWTVEDEPAPVLATWRFGLGKVVAFTSHGAGRWTRDLLPAAELSGVWGQLGHWASATDVAAEFLVSLDIERSSILVMATLAGGDGHPLQGRKVQASDVTPGRGASSNTRLTESRPGVYVAALDMAGAGDHLIRVDVEDGSFEPAEHWAHVPALEQGTPDSGQSSGLDALVVATGGAHATDVGALADRRTRSAMAWQPVVRPWLLAALVLFVAHVLMEFGTGLWLIIRRLAPAMGRAPRPGVSRPG